MKKLFKLLFFWMPASTFGSFYFELKSAIGRMMQSNLKVDPNKTNYINLGCGSIIKEGMINIDFFFEKGIDYGADLRYPLRIPSNSIDGIVCEHTIEHILYADVENLLNECHRILKPGGILRIILPNISKFANAYSNGDQAWFDEWERIFFLSSPDAKRSKRRIKSPLQALSFVMQDYGHISAWDVPLLNRFLLDSGFSKAEEKSHRNGAIEELLIDTNVEGRLYVSLYVEATK